jgi:hypothetical protein
MQSLQKEEQRGHAQQPLLFIKHGHFVQKKELLPVRFPSCSQSHSYSCSNSSKKSYANHHVSHDDHKTSHSLKHKYLYLDNNNDRHVHHPDKSYTVFAKGRRKSILPCKEPCQQSNIFVSHLVSLFQIGKLIV